MKSVAWLYFFLFFFLSLSNMQSPKVYFDMSLKFLRFSRPIVPPGLSLFFIFLKVLYLLSSTKKWAFQNNVLDLV